MPGGGSRVCSAPESEGDGRGGEPNRFEEMVSSQGMVKVGLIGQPSFPKGTLMSFPIFLVNGWPSSKGTLATSPFCRLVCMRIVGR